MTAKQIKRLMGTVQNKLGPGSEVTDIAIGIVVAGALIAEAILNQDTKVRRPIFEDSVLGD